MMQQRVAAGRPLARGAPARARAAFRPFAGARRAPAACRSSASDGLGQFINKAADEAKNLQDSATAAAADLVSASGARDGAGARGGRGRMSVFDLLGREPALREAVRSGGADAGAVIYACTRVYASQARALRSLAAAARSGGGGGGDAAAELDEAAARLAAHAAHIKRDLAAGKPPAAAVSEFFAIMRAAVEDLKLLLAGGAPAPRAPLPEPATARGAAGPPAPAPAQRRPPSVLSLAAAAAARLVPRRRLAPEGDPAASAVPTNQAAGAVDAARDAAVKAAQAASSKLDSVLGDLTSSTDALKKRALAGEKEASAAVDELAAGAIARANAFKEAFAGNAALEAEVDAAVGQFAKRANALRSQLGKGGKAADQVIDEMVGELAAAADKIKAGVAAAAAGDGAAALKLPSGAPEGLLRAAKEYAQLWASLGSLYVLDQAIKRVFVEYGIKFPSALGGMFGVFALLVAVGDANADKIISFYSRGLAWIARWLPLFYVPALVTLPLALTGIPAADLARIVGILSVGMVATLLFTAQTTVVIREAVKTPVQPIAKSKPAPPFERSHYAAWGAVAAVSMALTLLGGAQLGAQMALPFGLACTVGGYLIGELVPKGLQGALHPVVVTSLVANAGAALHGAVMGWDYATAQRVYLAKGTGPLGAGDALMSLLGVVIISFGFRVYGQRATMRRHAPEIFGATALSAVFSLFSTAFAAKALGLSSALARALIPRSVTVALALPIAQGLEAPLAITAAAVLLQGILGANFGPGLMTAVGIKDTIARGLAAAGTAGGLGTASLTSKEPEALPFCALSYAMVGIFSTLICSTPAVRAALVAIVG